MSAVLINNLQFSWEKSSPSVLSIEKFKVDSGERIFIEGSSGSGKSTFLSLISGILLPTRGEIEVLGKNLNQMSNAERDEFRGVHFGIIFQQFNLVPYLNVLDNVLLPLYFSKKRKSKLLNRVGSIEEEFERLMKRLSISSSKFLNLPAELSVGQQQRVAIARALMGDAELILADEPTSALDRRASEEFISLLLDAVDETQKSLIFVSHDQTLSSYFDRRVQMESFQ